MDSTIALLFGLLVVMLIFVMVLCIMLLWQRSDRPAGDAQRSQKRKHEQPEALVSPPSRRPSSARQPVAVLPNPMHDVIVAEKQTMEEINAISTLAVRDLKKRLNAVVATADNTINEAVLAVLEEEKAAYRKSLATVRKQNLTEFAEMQQQLREYRSHLHDSFEKLVQEDRQAQLERFNERLDDVVSSYIIEALDNNVDLGSQMKYIIASLEEHKEDIKRDVSI